MYLRVFFQDGASRLSPGLEQILDDAIDSAALIPGVFRQDLVDEFLLLRLFLRDLRQVIIGEQTAQFAEEARQKAGQLVPAEHIVVLTDKVQFRVMGDLMQWRVMNTQCSQCNTPCAGFGLRNSE